jgi:hypothetical protein
MKQWIGVVCATLLAMSSVEAADAVDAKKLADVLTGDAKGSAANNPQCKLFTPAEIAKYLGQPVNAGQNAAGGSGCQWPAKKDDEADAIVQVVASRYFVAPSGSKGFKPLPNIGSKGFVAQQYDGWSAGAIVGDLGIWVNVSGKAAKDSSAIALLEETIKRLKP